MFPAFFVTFIVRSILIGKKPTNMYNIIKAAQDALRTKKDSIKWTEQERDALNIRLDKENFEARNLENELFNYEQQQRSEMNAANKCGSSISR